MPWQNNDDKLYHTDGKWVTVTLPLANFVYDYDGNKGLKYSGVGDFDAFNIFIVKGLIQRRISIAYRCEVSPNHQD